MTMSCAGFLSPEIACKKKRTKRSSTKEKAVSMDRRSCTKEKRDVKVSSALHEERSRESDQCYHRHLQNRHFTETLDAVNSYIEQNRSKCFSSVGGLVPVSCNWYDMFLTRRLGLITALPDLLSWSSMYPQEYLETAIHPHDHFASFAVTNISTCAAIVTKKFDEFLLSLPEDFSNLSVSNLLIFLSFLSSFPTVIDILKKKKMIQSLVSSLLAMLTEKKDCARLAMAIAVLAHVVEHHPSMSGILSESNISQLLKLCTARALYPVTEPDVTQSAEPQPRTELEIGVSRLV